MNAKERPWRTLVGAAVFVVLLALLTRALLTPIPAAAVEVVGGGDSSFWISKTVHVAAYAFLAWMVTQFPIHARWRALILVGLILHGCLTEYLQQFVGRGSSPHDAILDTIGVGLGTTFGWLLRLGRQRCGR